MRCQLVIFTLRYKRDHNVDPCCRHIFSMSASVSPQLTGCAHHWRPVPPFGVLHVHRLRSQPHDERSFLVWGHNVLWEARQREAPRQSIFSSSHCIPSPMSRPLCTCPAPDGECYWSAWSSTSSDSVIDFGIECRSSPPYDTGCSFSITFNHTLQCYDFLFCLSYNCLSGALFFHMAHPANSPVYFLP